MPMSLPFPLNRIANRYSLNIFNMFAWVCVELTFSQCLIPAHMYPSFSFLMCLSLTLLRDKFLSLFVSSLFDAIIFIASIDYLLEIWTSGKAGILDQKSAMQSHVKTKRPENYSNAHMVKKTTRGYSDANAIMKKTGSCHDACCFYPKEILFI